MEVEKKGKAWECLPCVCVCPLVCVFQTLRGKERLSELAED